MSKGLDPNRIDKLLLTLKPNAMEYLRVFYLAGKGAQFQTCARKIGVSEATFATNLHHLDATFADATEGVRLLRRTPTGWELTPAGVVVGERVVDARLRLYEAIDEARDQLTLWVTLANDCWREFGQLAEAFRGNRLSILPYPVRSTELHLHDGSAPSPETLARSFALYTTCIDTQGRPLTPESPPAKLPGPAGSEVLITRVNDFRLLARREVFGTAKYVSHNDLVAQGVGLVLPESGAVMDFLNMLEPPWAGSRVRRYRGGTDFDHCRGTLFSGVYAGSAMLVHGLEEAKVPSGYTTTGISDLPHVKAITGFYRRPVGSSSPLPNEGIEKPWPNEAEEAWITVWRRAIGIWGAGEVAP